MASMYRGMRIIPNPSSPLIKIPPSHPFDSIFLIPSPSCSIFRPNYSSRTQKSLRVSSVAAVKSADPSTKQSLKITDPSGQPSNAAYGTPLRGCPEPLGVTLDPRTNITNFALFSSNATSLTLCLFTERDLLSGTVTYQLSLCPQNNKTGDIWHIALPDIDSSLLYGYVVDGPAPDGTLSLAGHGFDPEKVLLDPYAKAIFNGRRSFGEMGPDIDYKSPDVLGFAATWPQAAAVLPSAVEEFDWEGDKPLQRPMEDLIIYEAHVRGFTADASSRVKHPGTYLGLVEKLDYLKALGVTAIELMPVHEFNELEYYRVDSAVQRYNFWGYSTVGYFAPMTRYSAALADAKAGAASAAAAAAINEFKTFVKESHRRGIEVILDVVFNHTAEGNENGLTISFRGIDNRVYYMLAPGGECYNYSGCGNTFNCNHPVARQFIIDCLKYWVEEMHVDGFRFDLASIMTRAHSTWYPSEPVTPATDEEEDEEEAVWLGYDSDGTTPSAVPSPSSFLGQGDWTDSEEDGRRAAPFSQGAVVDERGIMTDGAGVSTGTPLTDPPLIAAISADPVLSKTKLIAEAWDCDGLYQVGAFPHYGGKWSEWNGTFRDATRQFIKGTDGNWTGAFASALCGSPNIYINEPGEHDWWGNNGGRKWKGQRGPTASINFVTAHDGFTLVDLVSYNEKHNEANGEENRDGESHNLSWNCGAEGPTDDEAVRSLRRRQTRNFMAALLLSHGVPMLLMGDEYGHSKGGNNNTYCHDTLFNYFDWEAAKRDEDGLLRFTRHMISLRKAHNELRRSTYVNDNDVQWHGITPEEPDWSETSRFLALTLRKPEGRGGLYVAFNTGHVPQMVTLPRWDGRVWQPVVDTGKAAPFDVLMADERLSEEDVAAAKAASQMWTLEHAYPVLPWSCIVLESVPGGDVVEMPEGKRRELSSLMGDISGAEAEKKVVRKRSKKVEQL